jgi:prevent-host-death family protein
MTTTADIREFPGELAELLRQVEAGHEVLLTRDDKPVARLVPAPEVRTTAGARLRIRSLTGHRVLTPVTSQSELAEEMFAPR